MPLAHTNSVRKKSRLEPAFSRNVARLLVQGQDEFNQFLDITLFLGCRIHAGHRNFTPHTATALGYFGDQFGFSSRISFLETSIQAGPTILWSIEWHAVQPLLFANGGMSVAIALPATIRPATVMLKKIDFILPPSC
jgi:hypothetical protein